MGTILTNFFFALCFGFLVVVFIKPEIISMILDKIDEVREYYKK